jgi:hypothetical protein
MFLKHWPKFFDIVARKPILDLATTDQQPDIYSIGGFEDEARR